MSERNGRPNVVLILADQHRPDCLGAAGNGQIATPNLDRITREGISHDGCYCAYPVCTPSRYSLLSGLPVQRHRGWSNRSTLSPEIPTFVRELRNAGYATTAVGKMHFTPTYLDVGFEKMLLCEQDGDGRWDDDYHRYLMRHGLADRLDLMDQRREYRREAPQKYWNTFGAMASNLPEEHHSTTWIGRQAELAASAFTADGGSFLMVGFVKPHHPFDPPAEWLNRYDESNMEIPRSWTEAPLPRDAAWSQGYFHHAKLTEAALRRIMAHYYATISHMDYWVGRIIASLEENGTYENTMIVFTADHGEYLGFHHLLLKGGPLYEPLVRVPLLVKSADGSAAEPAESAAETLCSNTDIGAMILAACDLGSPPPGLGGEPHGRDYVCAHAPSRGAETASAMVRSRHYKFMRGPVETMFFDLDLDPHELNNAILNPEYRDVVAEHEATLTEFEGGEAPRPDAFTDPDAPTVKPEHGYEPDRETVIDYFRSAMGSH